MHWHARSRRLSRPGRATPAGQDAAGDRADRLLSPPPVPGITTSAWALRRVFAGRADQVRHARRFVKAALDEGCPLADLVVLLSDELVTNAVVHTRSGDGGLFEVRVWSGPSFACVAVLDGGSGGEPSPAALDTVRESGRGLALVDALAAHWGHAGGRDGRITWFVVRWQDDGRPLGAPGRAG
jgi:anti-sigma regulatory factor (Ser/Thr protein kinase)